MYLSLICARFSIFPEHKPREQIKGKEGSVDVLADLIYKRRNRCKIVRISGRDLPSTDSGMYLAVRYFCEKLK